jgi:hypothetical protein
MANKIKLDDEEYSFEDLSDVAKSTLTLYQFADLKLKELNNMLALLQRAKNSYMDSLKKEMLSDKAGFLFDDG